MRRFSIHLLLSGAATALLAFLLTGCDGTKAGDPRNVAVETKPAVETTPVNVIAPAPTPREDPKWGSIKGQAVWGEKKMWVPPAFAVPAGPCLANGPILSEEFVIDAKTKGVRNVFVWLVDAKDKKTPLPVHPDLKEIKIKDVAMDQPCCTFEPHALILREGQTLVAKNSAPFAHNYNLKVGPVAMNLAMPPNAAPVPIPNLPTVNIPGMVQCNIHGWMKAWIMVCNSPYYALTGADGTFEIKNAPAGEWRLMTWHEGMGWVVFDDPDSPKTGKLIKIKGGESNDLGTFQITKGD
jgi:hypothetical protein